MYKRQQLVQAVQDENVDMVAFEKDKIRGAIRTDFILSAEIIILSLGTMAAVSYTHLDVYKRQRATSSRGENGLDM